MTASGKKTILVLGANAGQADLIRHMRERGWRVAACAHRRGEAGEALADEFHLVDIRDVPSVVALARAIKADLVYSISSDVAMTSVVAAAIELGCPHFFDNDIIDLFNRKERLRAALNAANISPVAFQSLAPGEALTGWNAWPCVVKPSDAQGQRGVRVVHNEAEAREAIVEAFKYSDICLVEEYLDGVEFSCNVLLRDGAFIFDVFSERLVHEGPLSGIARGHLVPALNVSAQVLDEARQVVHAAVAMVGVTDGCLYFQMKATRLGVRIIEIAPRLDGCHMWRLIKHATARDLLAETMDCLLGDTPARGRVSVPGKVVSELYFQQAPPGSVFKSSQFLLDGPVGYHEYRFEDGALVTPINGRLEVVGYFVRDCTPERVGELLEPVS